MAFQGDSIFWVEVEKVVPNPFQPRREFDEERLQELADSIRMYGVLQPLTVTRKEVHSDDGAFRTEYELIAGERRLRASRLAGVAQVPVIIRSGEQTEQEKLELAIIENLQREDLNAVDRAMAFKQLAEAFHLSHVQVAKKVGRSREYVSNSIRLLALPTHMLDGLKRGDITEGHARTLLMLKDKPDEQEVVYREILLKKLSVREVERIARKIATDKVRKQEYKDTDAHLIEIERAFTDALGTRVQILKTDFGGKLTIDYFSEDDLDTLLKAMKSQNMKIAAAAMEALSPEAASVNETVIREMDSDTKMVMGSIAESTPLEVVDDEDSSDAGGSTIEHQVTDSSATAGKQDEPDNIAAVAKRVLMNETGSATEKEDDKLPTTPTLEQTEPVSPEQVDTAVESISSHDETQSSSAGNISHSTTDSEPEATVTPLQPKYSADDDAPLIPSQAPYDGTVTDQPKAAQSSKTAHDTTSQERSTAAAEEVSGNTTEPTPASLDQTDDQSTAAEEAASAITDTEQSPAPAGTATKEVSGSYSSLRARLEAELARLEALDKAEQTAPSGTTETSTTANDNETVAASTETKSDRKDDNDLYSIHNFNV